MEGIGISIVVLRPVVAFFVAIVRFGRDGSGARASDALHDAPPVLTLARERKNNNSRYGQKGHLFRLQVEPKRPCLRAPPAAR